MIYIDSAGKTWQRYWRLCIYEGSTLKENVKFVSLDDVNKDLIARNFLRSESDWRVVDMNGKYVGSVLPEDERISRAKT